MSPKNALSGARLALAAVLCAAWPAHAGDKTVLRPVLDVEQGFDSNIFNDSEDEEGSLVSRISPGLWIENTGELGYARLGLTAVARNVWRESDLSGIDGLSRGEFERKLTPRLSVFGNGLLEDYSGYDEIDESGPGNQGGEPILSEQPAWKRDELGGGFRYLLTERLSLRLSGSAGRVNYERVDETAAIPNADEGSFRDRTLFGARSVLLYQLTAVDQVMLDVDLDDTSYQDLGTGTNDTAIWMSQVGWTRNWTQFWSSTARIGVRSLETRLDDVPQNGSYIAICGDLQSGFFPCEQRTEPNLLPSRSFSNSGTGLIGSLSLRRAFARSAIEFSYDRDTRSTGGGGRTNFDIDSFTLAWTQRLAERVKLSLSGNYSLYHSVTDEIPSYAPSFSLEEPCFLGGTLTGIDAPIAQQVFQCFGGSSEEKREYTTLSGRLDWQLRRSLNAYVVARYYASITDETLGSRSEIRTQDLDKFTLGVGFRYFYDLGL